MLDEAIKRGSRPLQTFDDISRFVPLRQFLRQRQMQRKLMHRVSQLVSGDAEQFVAQGHSTR